MDDVVCLFHGDCFDGLGAAWAVARRYPKGRFIPVDYRDPPPSDLEGKHVVIVDFSYPVGVMREILAKARFVTFLDHHPKAEGICVKLVAEEHTNLYAEYDANRSGCGMAWDHFHQGKRRPQILNHIEARDLWRSSELPGTEVIMEGMGIYPLCLKAWSRVLDAVDHNDPKQEHEFLLHLETNGSVISIKNDTDAERVIQQTLRYISIAGYDNIPLINVPRYLASDALSKLTPHHPFALGYYDDPKSRIFSMRSCKKTGVAVQPLAEQLGGGGHLHAAAFTVPRDHELARL